MKHQPKRRRLRRQPTSSTVPRVINRLCLWLSPLSILTNLHLILLPLRLSLCTKPNLNMPSLTPLKRSPLSIHRLHVRLFSQPVDSPPSSLTLFEISHSNHPKNPNFTYFLKWVSGITFVGSGLGYFYYSDSAFDSLKNSFSSFAEWSKATKESMTGKNPKFLFGGIFVII